jgi:hypothetical protein
LAGRLRQARARGQSLGALVLEAMRLDDEEKRT